MLKKAIIVDLDGCLFEKLNIPLPATNSREEWDEFQENYHNIAQIIPFIKNLILRFSGYKILFVTSREARKDVIKNTFNSIIRCFTNLEEKLQLSPNSFDLLMRNNDDYRPSHEVKKDIYTMFIKDRYDVEFAIDDEDENIKMWRSLGIPCLQVFS
jgi:hypothetical protein